MDEDTDDIASKRDRSPIFPYLGLTASIDLAKKLHQVARSSEVRLAQIAPYWNTTATSGALARYAGALQGYGLIESSGSRDSRKIRITDDGRRILEDTRPGIAEGLKSKAALNPKMFEALFAVWGRNRPADDIARSALQFDYDFTPVAAKRFLAVFDEAISYVAGEAGKNAGAEVTAEAPTPAQLEQIRSEDRKIADQQPAPQAVRSVNHFSTEDVRTDVFALDEGEAVLTIPRQLSRDSFDDLVAWLDLVKRKIERSIIG